MTTKTVDRLMGEATRIKDPLVALERIADARRALTHTHSRLSTLTRARIDAARDLGHSWPEIGDALGVSQQRAAQLGTAGGDER